MKHLFVGAHCYVEISPFLQLSKSYGKARDAFEKAAAGHHRQGSPWHSAKNLEKAADMAKESGGMDFEVLYQDAARAYLEAGRTQAAAEALARAARHLEGLDPKASSEAPSGRWVAVSMYFCA